jgi:ribosomal-protein-alanine N-acetyltransferase
MSCVVVVGPLHAAAMAAVHAAAMPPAEAWDEAAIAAQLGVAGTFGLLDPAGGMLLARVVAGEAEILALAVVPSAARQGRGTALLAAAESRAAGGGARVMYLEVAEANGPACALYARAGYVPLGRRAAYYRDGGDALVLRKPLSPAATTAG